MKDPVIQLPPTLDDLKRKLDELIEPFNADKLAPLAAELLLFGLSPDADEKSWETATEAAKHAYLKTGDFNRGFLKFLGYPVEERQARSNDSDVTRIERTQ